MHRVHLKALALLAILVALFYWKFLFSKQFSLLTGFEGVNQAYAWANFIGRSLKEGQLPIWDPYTFSGRSFVGETQTGAFYPLNVFFAFIPFNKHGMLSPSLYHYLYAGTHIVAAYFMFCLACRLGLTFYGAILSGVCFSLGGTLARLGEWPHLLHAAIWLPVILLGALKAIDATHHLRVAAFSAISGVALGMAVLAGGIHLVFMHVIVLATASLAYIALDDHRPRHELKRGAAVVSIVLLAGILLSAIQILPSIEYSKLANRYVGDGAFLASERIPYHMMDQGLLPNAILGLLFAAPATSVASGEYVNPYIGVLPLLLASIAIWQRWQSLWVKYFAGLAVSAFVYSLGSFSLLHGLSYSIIPKLWIAREANRFMYLADFALVILAGYGFDALFAGGFEGGVSARLRTLLRGSITSCFAAMAIPMVYGKPALGPWTSLSLLLIIAACGLLLFVVGGRRGRLARFLVFGLVIFDLHAFDWSALNKSRQGAQNNDHLERLLSLRGVARFLEAKDDLFRVQLDLNLAPNLGDVFGIATSRGSGVSVLSNYDRIRRNIDLLNVRYLIRQATAGNTGPVYEDAFWKVYERPTAFPRVWLVHEVIVEPSVETVVRCLDSPNVNLRAVAFVPKPLGVFLEDEVQGAGESALVERYETSEIEIRVRAAGRGLLVMSEVFYPGWYATVNGQSAEIHEVDHALRGVVVPKGESKVVLVYRPMSIRVGAALTLISWTAVVLMLGCCWFVPGRKKRQDERGDYQ